MSVAERETFMDQAFRVQPGIDADLRQEIHRPLLQHAGANA